MSSRMLITVLAASVLASVLAAAPEVVYVQVGGKWTEVKATRADGQVTVNLGPEQIRGGKTVIVVSKPSWMVLDDVEAPRLAWLKINGQEVKAGESGDLGVLTSFPVTLSAGFKDNANPLNAQHLRFDLPGGPMGVKLDLSRLGFPKPTGQVAVTIPKLEAGHYHATLAVSDMSPAGNELLVNLGFTVTGISVAADKQSLTLAGVGGTYMLQAKGTDTLRIGNAPVGAYLTSNVQSQHMYLDKITSVETLVDQPGLKTVRVSGLPGKSDKDQDGTKLCRLEYDLTLRDDLPCLLVTSRTVNLGPKGSMYCWWGWLPGEKWFDATGGHDWTDAYTTVGKSGWVFLPSGKPDVNGIGWISPDVFGESRFRSMLLYTDPTTIDNVETNASVEIPFALMSADKPEAVAAVAEKIKALKLWP